MLRMRARHFTRHWTRSSGGGGDGGQSRSSGGRRVYAFLATRAALKKATRPTLRRAPAIARCQAAAFSSSRSEGGHAAAAPRRRLAGVSLRSARVWSVRCGAATARRHRRPRRRAGPAAAAAAERRRSSTTSAANCARVQQASPRPPGLDGVRSDRLLFLGREHRSRHRSELPGLGHVSASYEPHALEDHGPTGRQPRGGGAAVGSALTMSVPEETQLAVYGPFYRPHRDGYTPNCRTVR